MTTQPLSTEAAALHAVIEDDEDEARRILATFLPGELADLIGASRRLAALAHAVRTHQCLNLGPRIGAEGSPTCVLHWDHEGPHRAHESWGEVTW